jgi:protein-S-isoprenylcysteine O-methyltransferase Ste14
MSNREKWILTFNKAAKSSNKLFTPLTLLGFIFFLTFNIGFISLALWLDTLLKLPGYLPSPWGKIIAAPVILFGLFFMSWSVGNFLKARGTPVPFNPPKILVIAGPYAYTRNPMMTGLFGLLFGLGLLFNSIMLTFVITPLIIFIAVLQIKKIEEPELEMRFGNDYLEYKKRVPMFVPRWKGRD